MPLTFFPSASVPFTVTVRDFRTVNEMEADGLDRAFEDAARSAKFDAWLKKIDAGIDAGRTKLLDEIINDA